MPQIYISKYNRFVDAVLNRINRLLGKQYDPVRVKLLSNLQRKNDQGKKNLKNKGKGKKKGVHKTNKMAEIDLARSKYEIEDKKHANSGSDESQVKEDPEFVLISKVGNTQENVSIATTEVRENPVRPNNNKKKTSNSAKKTGGNKKKNTTKKTTTTNNKTKQSPSKNKQKARATLFGLSSLKRDGDVNVNMMPDHTTVKTNFVLGPLTLRVEREVAKSGKRELRSATATTAEMYGRLNLRIVHGGAATLHSIRVLQPKQVRIDSIDDHDKTTEFMWKRSPQIASLVSQQLAAAARSMLKPPPQPRP